jgi:response regulator RpfG family c-di-GMP phosphodiesterase
MKHAHIICVDDEPIILQSLQRELRKDPYLRDFSIEIVDSGERGLKLIDEIISDGNMVSLILSDQRMPIMNGDTFLIDAIKKSPGTLGILLTGYTDINAIVNLINNNALYRYLSKPWDRNDLIMTVKEACKAWEREQIIEDQRQKIQNMTMAMVTALESANFFFDEETGNHIKRISLLSEFLAKAAGLEEHFVQAVKMYSPLHDIGKVGLKKEVLLKPGKLTKEEFEHVKEHVHIGYRIVNNNAIDSVAKNIILYHHEKWNGTGYPEGLVGESIPLEARIVSIADVYDALVSERVYKPAYSVDEALNIIRNEIGISFDPSLAKVFLEKMESSNVPGEMPFSSME